LLKPAGAQRNTQNPHIVDCKGVLSTSASSLPAPTVSPLHSDYRNEMKRAADVLNGIKPNSIQVQEFDSLSAGVKILTDLCNNLELPN
jgi:CRISPR-associated protein Cst2